MPHSRSRQQNRAWLPPADWQEHQAWLPPAGWRAWPGCGIVAYRQTLLDVPWWRLRRWWRPWTLVDIPWCGWFLSRYSRTSWALPGHSRTFRKCLDVYGHSWTSRDTKHWPDRSCMTGRSLVGACVRSLISWAIINARSLMGAASRPWTLADSPTRWGTPIWKVTRVSARAV